MALSERMAIAKRIILKCIKRLAAFSGGCPWKGANK